MPVFGVALKMKQLLTSVNPAASENSLYPKSDNKWYSKNSAGTEVLVGPATIPTELPPSGPAGGELAGTYPNPTILDGAVVNAKLGASAVSNAKILNDTIAIGKLNTATVSALMLDVKDEGALLAADVTSINFAGAGVTGARVGSDVTVTIPGGGSSSPEVNVSAAGPSPRVGELLWVDSDEPTIDLTKVALGQVAYAQITANVNHPSGTLDVPGLVVTFIATAGRRYRISSWINVSSAAGGNWTGIHVREVGLNNYGTAQGMLSVNTGTTFMPTWIGTLSAGSHTFQTRVDLNTGSATVIAAAGYPSFILVEDIGA